MKKPIAMMILGLSLAAALTPAQARNVKYVVSIQNSLASEQAKGKLDNSVKLSFGPQASDKGGRVIASVKAHGKSSVEPGADLASCNASFADALATLQKHAQAAGAEAVVNIVSYFKNNPPLSSATEFECHTGSVNSHVMLKGDIVKAGDK